MAPPLRTVLPRFQGVSDRGFMLFLALSSLRIMHLRVFADYAQNGDVWCSRMSSLVRRVPARVSVAGHLEKRVNWTGDPVVTRRKPDHLP